jgi:hypothetical protein
VTQKDENLACHVHMNDEEKQAATALVHTCGHLFVLDLVRLDADMLIWRMKAGGKLLGALESLHGFTVAGSATQELYGKVLRVHQRHVN